MDTKKYNKNFWKRLTKEYNDYIEMGTYNQARIVRIELTGFFNFHEAERGMNPGESTLLKLDTKLIEAREVYFHFDRLFTPTVEVYYNSTINSANKVFFECRKKNKTVSGTFNKLNNAIHFETSLDSRENKIYFKEDLLKRLIENGYKVLTVFEYSDKLYFNLPHTFKSLGNPKYVKKTKNIVEMGFKTVSTYNSLPFVVKVVKSRKMQTQSLSELGAEARGYYSHHVRCKILPEQTKMTSNFVRKFNKKAKVIGG